MTFPNWAVSRLATYDYDDVLRASVTHELARFWDSLSTEAFERLPVRFHAALLDSLAFAIRTRLTRRVEKLREAKRESDHLSAKLRDQFRDLVALLKQEQQLEREYGLAAWTVGLQEALDGVSQESEFLAHRAVTGLGDALSVWQHTSQPGPTLLRLIEHISRDRERSMGSFLAPLDFPPNSAARAIPLLDLFDETFERFLRVAMLESPQLSGAQLAAIYSAVTGGDYTEDAAKKRIKRIRKRTRDDSNTQRDV